MGRWPPSSRNLLLASWTGDLESVTRCLSAGISPNTVDRAGGVRPLHHSAGQCHIDVTQALLAGHADVDAPDQRGRTPLMYAIASGHTSIQRLLLAAGAQPNNLAKDIVGRTAVEVAQLQVDPSLLWEGAAGRTMSPALVLFDTALQPSRRLELREEVQREMEVRAAEWAAQKATARQQQAAEVQARDEFSTRAATEARMKLVAALEAGDPEAIGVQLSARRQFILAKECSGAESDTSL